MPNYCLAQYPALHEPGDMTITCTLIKGHTGPHEDHTHKDVLIWEGDYNLEDFE